jgi:2-polyprenyl-3-methyl-5-hydroxy-6-metoxy-1,4-benzoquinol methylase
VEAVAVCDLCGNGEARHLYQVFDTNYGIAGVYHLKQCQACGLVYLDPRPSADEIDMIYPTDRYDPFRALYMPTETLRRPVPQERARWLTREFGTGRVLDVGCGDGLFLKMMRDLGWSCVGVEPNRTAAAFASAHFDLRVHVGDIFAVREEGAFDLVTFWDSLEHTPSPRRALQHAAELLRPGGILALSVPNWDSAERRLFGAYWIAIDAPRHFYHFSPGVIRRLAAQCGLSIESMEARAPVISLASNLLRWGGRLVGMTRSGSDRRRTSSANVAATTALSPWRRAVIRSVHLVATPINALLNRLNWGPTLTVIARKEI